jgi:hypothetical protein
LWFGLLPPHFWGVGLIAPAFVICFQQDDRHVLLNVITHVETNISPFQMALQDVRTMLPQGVRSHVPPFESLIVQFSPQL